MFPLLVYLSPMLGLCSGFAPFCLLSVGKWAVSLKNRVLCEENKCVWSKLSFLRISWAEMLPVLKWKDTPDMAGPQACRWRRNNQKIDYCGEDIIAMVTWSQEPVSLTEEFSFAFRVSILSTDGHWGKEVYFSSQYCSLPQRGGTWNDLWPEEIKGTHVIKWGCAVCSPDSIYTAVGLLCNTDSLPKNKWFCWL